MEEQELQSIANQLSCPVGEVGIDIGNKMNKGNQFITTKSIEKLSAKRDESIVEIGPGNGFLSLPLLDVLGVGGHYLGIEKSEVMADELHRTVASNQCKVKVFRGEYLAANIEAESVDGVMGVNVLYFIEDLLPFFKHIFNWVKVDGRAVFGIRSDKTLNSLPFTQYGFNIRSANEIMSLMSLAGFTSITSFVFEEGITSFGDIMIPVDSVIIVGRKHEIST